MISSCLKKRMIIFGDHSSYLIQLHNLIHMSSHNCILSSINCMVGNMLGNTRERELHVIMFNCLISSINYVCCSIFVVINCM
jgi:hypothetical protein